MATGAGETDRNAVRRTRGVPSRLPLPAARIASEERGWIKGAWVEKPGERRRRFYRLTATGRRVLVQQRATWDDFVEAVRLAQTRAEHA